MSWLVAVVLAGIALAFIAARGRTYRNVFSDEHLLELEKQLPALKGAALSTPNEPQTLQSAHGLALVYSVSPGVEEVVHHVSVSLAGGVTPGAVGVRFRNFAVELLGLPRERAELSGGHGGVFHAQLKLTRAEHEVVVSKPVPTLSAAERSRLLLQR
ncbi:MAG: hypothetical protein ACO1OB_31640 [Archangium sp.]